MKKLLATTFVLLTLFSVSFGQKLQIGIFSGFGVSQLSSQKFNQRIDKIEGPLNQWNIGLSVTTKLNKRLFFETDYTKCQKGTLSNAHTMEYTYLGISPKIQIKVRKNQGKKLQPFVKIGSYFSYLSDFKSTAEHRLTRDLNITYEKPQYLDYGFNLNLGLEYKFAPHVTALFEGSYERGLRELFGNSIYHSFLGKKIYNLAAWGNVGLKFNL
jgi:hypothetical protein